MVDVARLTVRVDSDTRDAETGLKRVHEQVTSMAGMLGSALTAGAVAGTAALVGGFGASIAAASGFEKTLSGVKAVSGATGDEMKGLSSLALQLGKDTSFSASAAAAGIEELVKGGLTIPDIMNGAAKATLDLAAAGGVSLPDAATIAANALAQFNLKGTDMAHVADLIAGAANASALDVGQFKFSLEAAGAVASTVGFNFDDLSVAIAEMGKAGITGSDAGTSLKTMMMNLVPSTDKARSLMKELGIITEEGANQFFDATGKVRSMAQVQQVLQTSMRGLTEEQKLSTLSTIFGSDAIRAAAVLAKEGSFGFQEMAASMGKVTAASVGAERLNNLSGSFEQLKGSVETAAITLGTALLPAARSGVDAATKFVNGLIPVFERIGPSIATALTQAGDRITTFFGSLAGGESLATTVNKAFGDLIPPGLNTVLDAVDAAFKTFKETVSGFIPIAQAFLANRIDSALTALSGAAATVAQLLKGDFAGAFTTASGVVTTWLADLERDFGPLAETIAAAVAPARDAIVAKVQEWASAFAAWVGPAVKSFLAAWPGMLSGLLDAVEQAVPPLLAKLGTWGLQFAQWIGPAIPPMLVALGGITVALAAFVVETAGVIALRLGKWALAFVEWVALDALPKLPGELQKIELAIGQFVIDAVPGVLASAAKLGQSIVDGIASGVRGAKDALMSALRELGASLPAPVAKAIGFGSPAKAFMPLGASIVDGLRVGLTARAPSLVDVGRQIILGFTAGIAQTLEQIPESFDQMTRLFRQAAESVKGPINDLIGYLKQGISTSGYVQEFLKHVNEQTAGKLGDQLRGYFDEYLDSLGKMADGAVPAVKRVSEDLAKGLGDAVANATRSAQQAVDTAAQQIQQAIEGLTSSRELRGQHAAFDVGQSAEARARSAQREDAEAQYQLEKELARATTDEQRTQIMARFADAEDDRQHRRKLAEEDRLFADQQARERQAFEDALADDGLAKQLKRIQVERDARLAAVQDELKARQDAAVKTATTALTRIVEDVNSQINASIGKVFDNLGAEMAKRGGPTDPGFLGRVREEFAGLIVPIAGMLQSILANLAGIPNDFGPGVPLGVPAGPSPVPQAPGLFETHGTQSTAPAVVINVSGQVYGSTADLARILQPELQRLVRA